MALTGMNIRKVVGEIHAKARQQSAGSRHPSEALSPDISNELSILQGSYRRLYQIRGLIGQMPPSPNTMRARIGAHLIRVVQRMLFWYTPRIHEVQSEITAAIGSLARLVERQAETIAELRSEVATLQRTRVMDSMADRTNAPRKEPAAGTAIPPAFEFALQDRFRGSEAETGGKLEEWLSMIRAAGGLSAAPWLDIGCGRGEWLALVSAAGYTIHGIDANPIAVDRCRSRGLCVETTDAFEYLRGRPDGSLGLVSIFHVVEHIPVGSLLEILSLVFQKLSAGGMIAIETPNPANLLMGSHHFWNDPTHVRPVPETLLTFMLEYTGFTVVRRAGLNPFPPENHLPWAEVAVIGQLDKLLYGARDYGVLGRK